MVASVRRDASSFDVIILLSRLDYYPFYQGLAGSFPYELLLRWAIPLAQQQGKSTLNDSSFYGHTIYLPFATGICEMSCYIIL